MIEMIIKNYTIAELSNTLKRVRIPGNLREVVTPDMVALTRWFKSP